MYLGEEKLPDVNTVGGLVVTRLGRPPAVNDTVQFGDVAMVVKEVDGRAATRIQVTYPALDEKESAEEVTADTH